MEDKTKKSDTTISASATLKKTGEDNHHHYNHHSMETSADPEIDNARSPSHDSNMFAEQEKNDPEDPVPLSRMPTELGPAVIVPRLKRRGLLGQLTLVAEVENPKTYPRRMKWFITFIVAVAGATAPMGSSVFFRKSIAQTQSLDNYIDLTSFSFIITSGQGVEYNDYYSQPFHCTLHAKHVYLSSMVVVFQ